MINRSTFHATGARPLEDLREHHRRSGHRRVFGRQNPGRLVVLSDCDPRLGVRWDSDHTDGGFSMKIRHGIAAPLACMLTSAMILLAPPPPAEADYGPLDDVQDMQ